MTTRRQIPLFKDVERSLLSENNNHRDSSSRLKKYIFMSLTSMSKV